MTKEKQLAILKQVEQRFQEEFEINVTKEEPMYNKELEQQNYLAFRLNNVVADKNNELRDKYHLNDPSRPKTIKELKERLAEGKYTIVNRGYSEDYECNPYLSDFFSWRTVEADDEGYEVAYEKLVKAKTKVTDQIHLSYEAGLSALQAFESETFH